jgi:hypothetical protein
MRDRFDAAIDKRKALATAETSGVLADSMEVRLALLARVRLGEITLGECQAELKQLKRNAAKNGQTTRSKVWRQS